MLPHKCDVLCIIQLHLGNKLCHVFIALLRNTFLSAFSVDSGWIYCGTAFRLEWNWKGLWQRMLRSYLFPFWTCSQTEITEQCRVIVFVQADCLSVSFGGDLETFIVITQTKRENKKDEKFGLCFLSWIESDISLNLVTDVENEFDVWSVSLGPDSHMYELYQCQLANNYIWNLGSSKVWQNKQP